MESELWCSLLKSFTEFHALFFSKIFKDRFLYDVWSTPFFRLQPRSGKCRWVLILQTNHAGDRNDIFSSMFSYVFIFSREEQPLVSMYRPLNRSADCGGWLFITKCIHAHDVRTNRGDTARGCLHVAVPQVRKLTFEKVWRNLNLLACWIRA